MAKITVEQLKGGVPDVNANAFKDFLAGKDIPSRTTALLNAASAIVADGNLVGNGTLAERFAEATSWPRKPSIPARPKPVRQVDRNRQVQGVIHRTQLL